MSREGNYVLSSNGGKITATEKEGTTTLTLDIRTKGEQDKDQSGTALHRNGKQIAFQSVKQQEEGTITLGEEQFYVGKDTTAIDTLASGGVVKFYDSADAKNQLGVVAVQGSSRKVPQKPIRLIFYKKGDWPGRCQK